MAGNFKKALHFTLTREGGFSDDPDDPGGRTMKGITQSEYDNFRAAHNLPHADVLNILDQELEDIYQSDYWNRSGCNKIPDPMAGVLFDSAVNSGVRQAVKWLQEALGTGVDGVFGPNTQHAANAAPDPSAAAKKMVAEREAFLRALAQRRPAMKKFLKGWINRCEALRSAYGL